MPRPGLIALGAGAGVAVLFVAGRLVTGESLIVGPGYQLVMGQASVTALQQPRDGRLPGDAAAR